MLVRGGGPPGMTLRECSWCSGREAQPLSLCVTCITPQTLQGQRGHPAGTGAWGVAAVYICRGCHRGLGKGGRGGVMTVPCRYQQGASKVLLGSTWALACPEWERRGGAWGLRCAGQLRTAPRGPGHLSSRHDACVQSTQILEAERTLRVAGRRGRGHESVPLADCADPWIRCQPGSPHLREHCGCSRGLSMHTPCRGLSAYVSPRQGRDLTVPRGQMRNGAGLRPPCDVGLDSPPRPARAATLVPPRASVPPGTGWCCGRLSVLLFLSGAFAPSPGAQLLLLCRRQRPLMTRGSKYLSRSPVAE